MDKYQPIIGIICCQKEVEHFKAQAVHEKYIDAVSQSGGLPILLPREINQSPSKQHLFSMLNGILLTGSYSNVSPQYYGKDYFESYTDIYRDELSMQLVAYAKKNDLPLLGICRGHQELNVFWGGTLLQELKKNPNYIEKHSPDQNSSIDQQYADSHKIKICGDGLLSGFGEEALVNSLHNQCIDELGDDLHIEATSPDGLIEAISSKKHRFILGIQWHPEYNFEKNPLSQYIFNKFIDAAKNI